jgi:hypothetical protein
MTALHWAWDFAHISPDRLKVWCHKTARYVVPTFELVSCLRHHIGGRSAIEIGSGNSDLGWLMGIPETDSYVQQSPELLAWYRARGQVPTNPRPEVDRLDAMSAIAKYRPQVVVAAWFTRKFEVGKDVEGKAEASIFGEREEKILEQVETYIHVGNRRVHSQKTLLKKRHEEIELPGHFSRTDDQRTNVIWIWNRRNEFPRAARSHSSARA